MTDSALLLDILSDREPHSVEEIETRCKLIKGRRMTVHSRVADLRKEGYVITRNGSLRNPAYQLIRREEGAVRVTAKLPPPVQGYTFDSAEDDRNGTICKIVARAPSSDVEVLEMGPAFLVEFGDGTRDTVFASELSPWYPT